ncbi:hypothetical protein ACFLZ5_06880 [Thermodesulfobacteriota bacterium]
MNTKDTRLHDLIDIKSPSEIFAEIIKILSLVDPSLDPSLIENAFKDIIRLFSGDYPGYKASNTKYHDLEHTCAVTLATARLIHGLHVQDQIFSSGVMQLGLIGALFHDTGLIQTEVENDGTGAQYTIGHEDRSINLMKEYLSDKDFSAEDILDCSHIIMCTKLSLPIDEIPFRSEGIKEMGKILGSADLIAQMADKNYLEKLPLLFLEFKEAGMPGFETPLELFQNTEEFYHSVARTRLSEEMGNVSSSALYHFKDRWGIERDLYAESIKDNIKHMRVVTGDCAESYTCMLKKIRQDK